MRLLLEGAVSKVVPKKATQRKSLDRWVSGCDSAARRGFWAEA